jgi:hypothetical protein
MRQRQGEAPGLKELTTGFANGGYREVGRQQSPRP